MTTPTTTTHDAPARPARPIGARVVAAVLGIVALTAIAGPADAQTTTLPTPPTTLPAENPGSTAAGIVFFGVTAAIILGALVLYLRNRRPKDTSPRP